MRTSAGSKDSDVVFNPRWYLKNYQPMFSDYVHSLLGEIEKQKDFLVCKSTERSAADHWQSTLATQVRCCSSYFLRKGPDCLLPGGIRIAFRTKKSSEAKDPRDVRGM